MPTKHYNIVGKESELPYYEDEQRHKSEKEGFMAVYEKITELIGKTPLLELKNFEKNNQLKPLYNELYDYHYFSDADNKKIDKILKEKIKNEKNWGIIVFFVPMKYVSVDSDDEFSISFLFIGKYYQKKNGKWQFLFEKKVKNVEDDSLLSSKKYINSLLSEK